MAGPDLGSVATDIQRRLGRIPRPVGYDLLIGGNFEEQQRAFQELAVSLGLALWTSAVTQCAQGHTVQVDNTRAGKGHAREAA